MPIERVVAATDFSQASALALRRAARLAAAHGAVLHVTTVLPAGWLGQVRAWFAGADVQADAEAIGQRLAESADALRQNGRPAVHTQVLEGEARDEIAVLANRLQAHLLVVGAHGRSLVGETILGSTALTLLERCDVPILVVRNGADQDYQRLLVGVESSAASAQAVQYAAALCPRADLTLLHAYEDPFAAELFLGQANPDAESYYRARAREQAKLSLDGFVSELGELALRCHPLLAYGPPGLLLAHEAQHQHADLVVLGSRRKGLLEAALLGSVASNVTQMVHSDVLLVRDQGSEAR
ncbi:MAG: universal stress protein [Burkholderiaceae bacterium]|jgi:nucleotide-binding universal stress UspA family protein|nr:universal stress protein [Burkholderiaceae bacterium]